MLSDDMQNICDHIREAEAADLADPAFRRALLINLELMTHRAHLLESCAVPPGARLAVIPGGVVSLDAVRQRQVAAQ